MADNRNLVVLGGGGHANSVAEAAESAGFTVLKLIDASSEENSFEALASKIQTVNLQSTSLALGIGTNFARQCLYQAVSRKFANAKFPPILHHTAWISPTALVAGGVVALANATAGPNTSLGLGSIINTGASLDHDSQFGNFASLGPGARTGGNVTIGSRTMIGLQAGILQGRTVGEDSVVGAQSLVLEDIPSLSVAVGSPSRVIRSRERDERYY